MRGSLVSKDLNTAYGIDLDKMETTPQNANGLLTPTQSTLLSFPLEILVLIARCLVETAAGEEKYDISLFKRQHFTILSSLSSTHSYLRCACIDAGLLNNVTPIRTHFANDSNVRLLHQSQVTSRLSSLGIDLASPEVWPLCANILQQHPNLNELRLLGNVGYRASTFAKSTLGLGLALFNGVSLILRGAQFTPTSISLLSKLKSDTITSLFFDRSELQFDEFQDYDPRLRRPLFPNLRKVKYTGAKVSGNGYRPDFVDAFAHVFLGGCQLTHFELSYGFEPYCSGERHEGDPLCQFRQEKMLSTNFCYLSTRRRMLVALRQNSHASLQVFIDHTHLSGAFIDDNSVFQWCDYIRPPPFRDLRVLVFKCKNLDALALHRFPTHDVYCNSTSALPTARRRQLARHHHSAWRYVWPLSCMQLIIRFVTSLRSFPNVNAY